MKPTKLLLIILVITLSASAAIVVADYISKRTNENALRTRGWIRYENKDYGFSLEYPAGTVKQEENVSYIRFQNYTSPGQHVLQVGELYLEIVPLSSGQTCQDLLTEFSIAHLGNQNGYRGFAKPVADPNAHIPAACTQKNGKTILFQVTEGGTSSTTSNTILDSISF